MGKEKKAPHPINFPIKPHYHNKPEKLMNMNMCRTPLTLLATLCILPAVAQSSDLQQQETSIEKIQVTARKRSETMQHIPLAVSALDKTAIERSAINNLVDLQSQVPSLSIYAARGTSSTATVYIRGVGQSDPLWGAEPGVGIYLDDVYLARPQGALLDLLDVERVEVLRGPQGTLYGRNTVGGAIKYITRRPSDEFSAKADVALGSYGQVDAKMAAAGSLVKNKLLASIAFGSFNHDGFGENLYNGSDVSDKDILAARTSLLWLANDNLSLALALDKTRDNSNVRGARRMLVNGFELYFEGLPPLPISEDRYDTNSGAKLQRNTTDTQGASLTIDWDVNDTWSIKSVTAWRDGDTEGAIDFDLGPYPIADVNAHYFDEQRSQEFQLNYDGAQWQAVFGLYYMQAKAGGEVHNQFGLPFAALGLAPATLIPGPIYYQFGASGGQVDTDSVALYGDASWQFSDLWRLSLGLRAGRESKEAEVLNQGFTDNSFTQANGLISANFTNKESWTDVSPRISLDYQPNDDLLIYGSVAKGFKSGGFNVRANTLQVPDSAKPYEPESVLTYELGFKPTLANQLQLSMAFFLSQYKDIQLSIFTGVDSDNDGNNDGFFGDFTNAGRGRIRGVEFDYLWTPGQGWRLWGNAAYLDAQYQEYMSGGVNLADQKEFTDVPKLAYSFNIQKLWSWNNSAELSATLNYQWRDEVQPVTNQSVLLKQPAFGLLNATLLLTPQDSHWRLALEAKNLSDVEYRTTGYDLTDSGFPILIGYYGNPRTLTLRATYQF
jgi:iron complex outermembrane receptor protein